MMNSLKEDAGNPLVPVITAAGRVFAGDLDRFYILGRHSDRPGSELVGGWVGGLVGG